MTMKFSKQVAGDSDATERKVLANCESVLVNFEELPEYMKDNEFIRNYYRCEWPLKDVAFSIFSLHNETINIWTHLIGFFIFSKMMMISLTQEPSLRNVMTSFFGYQSDGLLSIIINPSNATTPLFNDSYVARLRGLSPNEERSSVPLWPWLVFLGGAMSCLIFSSISHLLGCHSRRFHYIFWRLDYTGISVMIVTSFFAPIYYMFWDHPLFRFIYLCSVTLIGTAVVITLLSPSPTTNRSRSFRATLFLCMGFSGVIPATHALILHWDQPEVVLSLLFELLMGLLYGVGALIYVTRVPERWKPGAFDIFAHGHQIFHIFVVVAALAHCIATLIIMDWRRSLPVSP